MNALAIQSDITTLDANETALHYLRDMHAAGLVFAPHGASTTSFLFWKKGWANWRIYWSVQQFGHNEGPIVEAFCNLLHTSNEPGIIRSKGD
jgi:hypothetical protein